MLQYADHIVFNSPSQLAKFGPAAKAAGKSIGLRINPECSTQEGHEIYDPCAPGSRLGTTRAQWDAAVAAHPELPALLDGLHFHTLCEQDADALAVTLAAVEEKFAGLLPRMKWLNFGGGHHITRPGYALATLENCILDVYKRQPIGMPDTETRWDTAAQNPENNGRTGQDPWRLLLSSVQLLPHVAELVLCKACLLYTSRCV